MRENKVVHVGGDKDGCIVDKQPTETDAIVSARNYNNAHDGEIGYIGVMILDADGKEVENWV